MDQEIRNKLRNVVTQCRRLLEDSISQDLEGKYTIFVKKDQVTADPNAQMDHLTEEEQTARKDILDHFAHIKARRFKPKDALDQLVREIAFTHLNRLCAYKMMEAREVYVGGQKFREAVSRGVNSNAVKFYLADHPDDERLFNTGHQDAAYRHFLDWLGGRLSNEIGVLFSPTDPANRLYPRQATLEEVLDLLNDGGIKAEEAELRREWPTIWSQDETIGWVYQYFTPKDLRDQSRKESQAPQNSYELAFRNQFFTPRYVVEFLTDNTLGRTWYEMRRGHTKLNDQCRYMVRRPNEVFLKEGEQPPNDVADDRDDLSQEDLLTLPAYILHRPKKDPRDLKVLDPACGSGHFLLYCFDLLLTIYEEAYSDPDLGLELRRAHPQMDDFRQNIPRLILEHNLHGIDIDLRASQIAALALWLRCQRAYREMGLNRERPNITRSNLVCAEPMPGEERILREFVNQLEPKFLGQVVEVVFDKMKLAGEVGSLLKIDEDIRSAVVEAKQQYVRESTQATDREGQPLLFTQAAIDLLSGKPAQPSLFDLTDITDAQFFQQAETKVIQALSQYAEAAQNGHQLQRRLFTDDAVRGFAFVNLCNQRYDVVLMNPPFGLPTEQLKAKLDDSIALSGTQQNLAWTFACRAKDLLHHNAMLGALVDRTIFQKSSYLGFRDTLVLGTDFQLCLDLGANVLDDANVLVSCFVLANRPNPSPNLAFVCDLRQRKDADKPRLALDAIQLLQTGILNDGCWYRDIDELRSVPFHSFAYWVPKPVLEDIFKSQTLSDRGVQIGGGLQCDDVFRFLRVFWEVPAERLGHGATWVWLYNGGDYSLFWLQTLQVVNWRDNGHDIKQKIIELGHSPSRHVVNEPLYFSPGLAGGKRGEWFDVHCLPKGMIFSNESRVFLETDDAQAYALLGYLNTLFAQHLVNVFCGQHKGSEYLRRLPAPSRLFDRSNNLGTLAVHGIEIKREVSSYDEVSLEFWSFGRIGDMANPSSLETVHSEFEKRTDELEGELSRVVKESRDVLEHCLGSDIVTSVECFGWNESPPLDDSIRNVSENIVSLLTPLGTAAACVSYAFGCVVGRFDVRCWTGERAKAKLSSPLHELPRCSPGMLQDRDGLLAANSPDDYPLEVKWAGILVDDPEHGEDIVRLLRSTLEVMFRDRANDIEREACTTLGVGELRDYFRKPGKGGFWHDHVVRYSKSRRKAPIYWLLQSSKKNYSIWLYYHRLDRDLLFKALVNYVEPKIRLETSRLEAFRAQRAHEAPGKEARRLAKDMERQDELLSELRDFGDKLRLVASLHLEPDLNDGAVLNIAPLHELVPWKEATRYWEELLKGEYEWSSIGKQLRQRGLVK